MSKIRLKFQLVRAAGALVVLMLLFALSGNANALSIITWQFENQVTVGPTDTNIEMWATATSDGIGGNANGIFITQFTAISLDPGTLIVPVGPYNLTLNSGSFGAGTFSAYGGSAKFLFGTLTLADSMAALGNHTSGFGFVEFEFSDAYEQVTIRGDNTFTVNVVPEPSTMLLLGSGLAGLGWYRRRRKAA